MDHKKIKNILLIRRVEETFLELFSKGKLNGTVHTSVGQELSAEAFAGQLGRRDFVFSNHRCHGHYISFTKDYQGLLLELLGKKNGVCGGIGSSQHLQNGNFYSNGIQSGIVPMAAGMALANKLQDNGNIGIVFIGDGTLGEGVLYETMNIISLWKLPLLIVCENNQYAQSTHFTDNLAGDIIKRASAFSINTFESDTWDAEKLFANAKESIAYVRKEKKPAFHLVDTYRLNAHSKGDDDRDDKEIKNYEAKDFLVKFKKEDPIIYNKYLKEINAKVEAVVNSSIDSDELSIEGYYLDNEHAKKEKNWTPVVEIKERQVSLINNFFDKILNEDNKVIFIGEDVKSPYGGAFKVANKLSDKYPNQVFTTPISEAAITGIGNGLALSGFKPFIEIMFGDFVTLAFDQIINHASKIFHMYNKKVSAPIVIRTPMGGGRGYGPTHSQSLDRFLIGIDNVKTIAINTLVNPEIIYKKVYQEKHPVILIENKTDYGKYIGFNKLKNYSMVYSNDDYPVVKVSPIKSKPNLTIVTYGGITNEVLECVETLFYEFDFISEIIVLSKISPIDISDIIESVEITKKLVVVEEGCTIGGISSEIISTVAEKTEFNIQFLKIGSLPVPIPAVKSLEREVIPNKERIINTITKTL
jgi:2-oxoisovalerate dehydrogenase E1 component